jgi:hypothetical protein
MRTHYCRKGRHKAVELLFPSGAAFVVDEIDQNVVAKVVAVRHERATTIHRSHLLDKTL